MDKMIVNGKAGCDLHRLACLSIFTLKNLGGSEFLYESPALSPRSPCSQQNSFSALSTSVWWLRRVFFFAIILFSHAKLYGSQLSCSLFFEVLLCIPSALGRCCVLVLQRKTIRHPNFDLSPCILTVPSTTSSLPVPPREHVHA